MVRFLKEAGADVNAKTDVSNPFLSPRMLAGSAWCGVCTDTMLPCCCGLQAGSTPLHYAAWRGRLDVVRFLKEAGADLVEKTNVSTHFSSLAMLVH